MNLILAHVRHSKFTSAYIYCIAPETLHWLCVYMVARSHAHQSKHLRSVKFSKRELC